MEPDVTSVTGRTTAAVPAARIGMAAPTTPVDAPGPAGPGSAGAITPRGPDAAPGPAAPRLRGRRVAVLALAAALLVVCAAAAVTGRAAGAVPPGHSAPATATGEAWRSAAVTAIFPATLEGAGDGGYRRLGIAPAAGCGVLPAALRARLAAAHCAVVLRSTYVDTTRTALATVGVVVLDGPPAARAALARAWPGLDADEDPALLPAPFAVPGSVAAGFGDASRVGWHAVLRQNGTYLCYAVTGFADGRRGSTTSDLRSGAWRGVASPPGQAAMDLPVTIGDELDAAVRALGGRP